MKKFKNIVLKVLMCLVMLLTFTSCKAPAEMCGRYNLTSISGIPGVSVSTYEYNYIELNDDYSYTTGLTCANSKHKSWLVNGKYWWTRSAESTNSNDIWIVCKSGTLSYDNYGSRYGSGYVSVRPVITISKSILLN